MRGRGPHLFASARRAGLRARPRRHHLRPARALGHRDLPGGLVPALREAGVDVVEAANERRRPPGSGGSAARNWLADAAWVQRELPRRARRCGADVAAPPAARPRPGGGDPQVVTVHDLAFERLPECFDRRFAAWARRAHRARRPARRRGRLPSPRRRRATSRRAGASPAERSSSRPTAPGRSCRRSPPEPEPRHFLYVGDDEPRKNLAALRAAHARYRERAQRPLPLVLAGAAGEPGAAERLAALYAGAAALVHPALHEGFGLTPLEAMRAGTPVLAARSPGVAESAATPRCYADPRDPEDLAARARAARGRRGAARRRSPNAAAAGPRRLSLGGDRRAPTSRPIRWPLG